MRRKQKGFSLGETMIVLVAASIAVGAVGYGFAEYQRQAAVMDAVQLVGAVQRSAELQDPTESLSLTNLVGNLDDQYRAGSVGSQSAVLHGFRGGVASVRAGTAGGIEVLLQDVERKVCGEIVSRVWPLVDGIAAGRQSSSDLIALKDLALGEDQAYAASSAIRKACVDGDSSRQIVLQMSRGFPAGVAPLPGGGTKPAKPAEPVELPVFDDPLPPPPPKDELF
jgi:type II secretory pathway pseudopilin PulG